MKLLLVQLLRDFQRLKSDLYIIKWSVKLFGVFHWASHNFLLSLIGTGLWPMTIICNGHIEHKLNYSEAFSLFFLLPFLIEGSKGLVSRIRLLSYADFRLMQSWKPGSKLILGSCSQRSDLFF